MKILIGLLLMSGGSAFSAQIFCKEFDSAGAGTSSHVLIKGDHQLRCVSAPKLTIGQAVSEADWYKLLQDQPEYHGALTARGPGLRIGNPRGIWFNCPLIHHKNIAGSKFFGLRAGASLFLGGAQAGIVANKNGGVCVVTGLDFANIGFDLSGVKVQFTRFDKFNYSL